LRFALFNDISLTYQKKKKEFVGISFPTFWVRVGHTKKGGGVFG
jgi:hypothetical protein